MRRATAPAICTISMSPSSVSKCQTTRSLFSLSLLNAGTNPPGMCSTDVTVPARGARLTWTFSGLMKIATRVRPSFHGMMLCTTPSAGEMTRPWVISRSGSRKNHSMPAASAVVGTATAAAAPGACGRGRG